MVTGPVILPNFLECYKLFGDHPVKWFSTTLLRLLREDYQVPHQRNRHPKDVGLAFD
jgi:hypothetical protein